MAYEEKKLEICSKHGISISELSLLVCLRMNEKEVTEDKALDFVKADLEKKMADSKKPSQSFIDSVNAEEYLVDYAKSHHPDDPGWFKNAVEKEYKGGKYGIEEEDAVRIAAMAYGWKPKINSEDALSPEIDDLSERHLVDKIRNGRIDRLTARINKVSVERPYRWEHRYRTRSRGIELTDGKYTIWLNCHDTSMYKTDTGKIIPANPMLERLRTLEEKSPLVGAIVTLTNIQTGRTKNGYLSLSTGPDSDLLLNSEGFAEIHPIIEPVGADV